MKKVVLISIILLLGAGLVYSAPAKIQVVKPADRDNIMQEQIMNIEWRVQGQISAQVKIQLFDKTGNIFVKNIIAGTPNDGKHKWRIPLNVNPGNYRVKITAVSGNVNGLSGLFKIIPKMTWEAPKLAMISTFKVNQQSPANSCTDTTQRVSINLPGGIHPTATATSVIQPIKYKFEVELTNPETGFDYVIHDTGWTTQNYCNVNPTYNNVLAKVFPGGVSGPSIPLSLQGRVTVWVKNGAQTEPPQSKIICIRLWL